MCKSHSAIKKTAAGAVFLFAVSGCVPLIPGSEWRGRYARSCSRVGIHQRRMVRGQFGFVVLGKRGNDQQIAHLRLACRRAIQRDHARTARAFDGVRGKTRTVVDVPDMHFFKFADISRFEQVFIDGARAFVMQLGMSSRDAMNLGFEHGTVHEQSSSKVPILMRRPWGMTAARGIGKRSSAGSAAIDQKLIQQKTLPN